MDEKGGQGVLHLKFFSFLHTAKYIFNLSQVFLYGRLCVCVGAGGTLGPLPVTPSKSPLSFVCLEWFLGMIEKWRNKNRREYSIFISLYNLRNYAHKYLNLFRYFAYILCNMGIIVNSYKLFFTYILSIFFTTKQMKLIFVFHPS